MVRPLFSGSALSLLLLAAPPAIAASDAELADIRRQIQELKTQYESRIRALEDRLKEAEQRPVPAPVAAAAPAPAAATGSGSANAFNPAISAILSGTYAYLSQDPARFALAGFVPAGEGAPWRRGFSLGESELLFTASVDPHFAGTLTLAVTPENTVQVEEAYGTYLGGPFGIATRFGRFLSGIGYLNEQHPHAWDFVDAPLAYQALLGGRYANDGVQLKWVAPIEQFLEVGAEAGNGDGFPGGPRNTNGAGSTAVFAHTGGDVGADHSWRVGLSYLRARTDDRTFTQQDPFGAPVAFSFAGDSRVAIADFVWKYAPNGNAQRGGVKLQAEWFRRDERGELAAAADTPFASAERYRARQSGGYAQAVYQFDPEWRAGARVDWLDPGAVAFRPKRASAMVDFNASEFSRIRLQYSRSRPLPDLTDHQWFVQYILSLGAHGAHKY